MTEPTPPTGPNEAARPAEPTLRTALGAVPVIAILRAGSARRFAEVTRTLCAAGVRAVEFTLTTPGALDALREYAPDAPRGTALGVGSVTTPAETEQAVAAGARYVISPATCPDVIAEARRLGVPVLPGALTPTEILTAWRAGAQLVKLFPASVGGPAYLRAVRAPLPGVPLVPTGGIGLDEARSYLDAGAAAIGMGGPLLADACESGSLQALAERTAGLAQAVAGMPRA